VTQYQGSPMGVAECMDCGNQWPCTELAWGSPVHWTRCDICWGQVWWTPVDDELVPA
jgi:hypothetical protein